MRWLGHASFYLESPQGVRLVTDPYGPDVSPAAPEVVADVVTISHEHYDHNYLGGIKGNPEIWRGLKQGGADWEKVDKTYKDVHAFTIPSYHDEVKGAKRGKNAIFVLDIGKLRVVHMGDLGHLLDDEQIKRMGLVDVLLIPVGGNFTIDAGEAWRIIERVKPRVVVPMHYLTEGMKDFPIAGLNSFISGHTNVRYWSKEKVDLSSEVLPAEMEIWVLNVSKL